MFRLGHGTLNLEDFRSVVFEREECELAEDAIRQIRAAREVVEIAIQKEGAVYGVNTGFGELANRSIPVRKLRELQRRLLLSHAAGVGEAFPPEVVRAMLLLRANSLSLGRSGIRASVIERLLEFLRRDWLPVVPERGSVGASGDLAPLAHLALPLIGEGELSVDGVAQPAAEVLRQNELEPLVLDPKEGLALINGTQGIAAVLAIAALEVRRLVRIADLIGALSADALRSTDTAFDERIHALRPHPGQQVSAANLWRLLQDSEIRESHRVGDLRVQDPYSVRCMPQVHGAVRDQLSDAIQRLECEFNSVTDNPIVLPEDGEILSGGNFHGEPLALAADCLGIATTELGSISERRLEKLTNQAFSGLPAFLVEEAGLNSGFMIAHVTAAALVSENKILAHPATVDSIPTSADKEDHVSMGMTAALKLTRIVSNVRRVLSIELLAAAQGIDLLRPLTSSPDLESLHGAVRQKIPMWQEEHPMAIDLEKIEAFVREPIDDYLQGIE